MAFQPAGPGSSSNLRGGVAPPPMMMNPAQFLQPAPSQLPVPSNPLVSGQTSNALPDGRQFIQGNPYNQASTGGVFQGNQQFHQNMPTQPPSQQQPDSTKSIYQNAGVYYNYNSVGQAQQTPYGMSNWDYGGEGIHNAQEYQLQPHSEQYMQPLPNNYGQPQQHSYDTYNPQGHLTTALPEQHDSNQNFNAHVPAKADSLSAKEQVEGGHVPYIHESNSLAENSLHPKSPVDSNILYQQQFIAPPVHEASREGSVSHGNVEQSHSFITGNLHKNSVPSYDQAQPAQSQQFPQHQILPSDAYSNNYREQHDYIQHNTKATINESHPSSLWHTYDQSNFGYR